MRGPYPSEVCSYFPLCEITLNCIKILDVAAGECVRYKGSSQNEWCNAAASFISGWLGKTSLYTDLPVYAHTPPETSSVRWGRISSYE